MKTSHTLSMIATLLLIWGCGAKTPEVPTDVSLKQTEDGTVSVQENNVTVRDANISDKERYKITFEAPPLTSPFDPEIINKKQPRYTTAQPEELPPPPPLTLNDKRPVKLSVEKIPVGKFAEVALGSVLGLNYVITPEAAAKTNPVSLNMAASMRGEDFFAIAQKIINDNGLLLSKEAGSTVFITVKPPKVEAKFNPSIQDTNIYYGRTLDPNVPDSRQITMFIPYYYVEMMTQFPHIKNFALSSNVTYQIFTDQKVIMIKDLAGNIKKALTYVDLFDRPTMKNKTAQIIPLRYVGAKNFIDRVREVLPSVGVPVAKKAGDLGLFLQELPELQSILVISDKDEWVNQLLYWRDKFDSLTALGDSPRMFVYQVKNRKADEIVSLVTGVNSAKATSEAGSSTASTGTSTTPAATTGAKTPAKTNNTSNSSGGGLINDVKIVADTNTNSLIIYTSPERYREIETILQSIDTLPRQVMVEVTIAELTLTDKLSYGLEWYLKHDGSSFSGTLQTVGNLGLGSSGLTGSIFKSTADFSALINAFAQKNQINILSRPKLVVLDNQEATINVGTEVPILTSSTTASSATTTDIATTQSVQYRTTGVILVVKPTVNSGGVLTLAINQSVSEAQTNNLSSISSPLILNRSINTNVVLRSGESVLLGGLISENKSSGNSRVPLFGDIPLLGNLFKTTSNSSTKTELVVLVKPVIIESLADYSTLSQAMGTISESE
ncbi:MAG: secretin N-terminal domain-containing protein [Sulfuricurvum sp.]|uniref:type II secretion system protein GspD n=1 Tax=Sulfuricurvum sp. TaxID=2025608 RepID=UPI00356B262B